MATIALPRPMPPHRSSSGINALSSTLTIEPLNAQASQCAAPVPNKHIPVCPTGPVPRQESSTLPLCPAQDDGGIQQSVLHPPDDYIRVDSGPLSLYKVNAGDVAAALDFISRQPLPEAARVFPWLHGLHPSNHIQQAFFIARRRALRRTPCCLRGITVVKADGDLTVARLKGAISPQEFLQSGSTAEFLEVDPKEGFSVRNFQIQAAKTAMTSDIIVYGDDDVLVRKLGWDIATAQQKWREKHESQGHPLPSYNTFICASPFTEFETKYPDVVAVDSSGRLTGRVIDFFHQERKEMCMMTAASEISHNVWMGPTPDQGSEEESRYSVLIECSDLGRINTAAIQAIVEDHDEVMKQHFLEFPSSGSILPPTWSHTEADGILETCKWIYNLAHGSQPPMPMPGTDDGGDTHMAGGSQSGLPGVRPRRILIHCADGYTESTLLGIAYFSYSTGRPVPEAWLHLHTTMNRNFFAYPTDVALLTAIAPRLLTESPLLSSKSISEITDLIKDEPRWLAGLDGSFPSRILEYMYLGNLGHANNPDLLKALGIGQVLSVGESAMWREGEREDWGEDNICTVQGVQDNGIDSLTEQFERCLEFIDRGRQRGTATLVHCRVGVSRSATICIAEVMRKMGMSFPRAYCFVRARRLNVIIQPHLRFAYELLKWEEVIQTKTNTAENGRKGVGIKRELEWGEIAREVALMNKPYAR
ncbi:Dual specificity phosphatase [Pleurostoma richardsiae]|uniref:Dual specificity phosphatase n=1 Tax=Pleurostoma richardsiae TaxID=41990 RepID=A0AA38RWP3_9PEZI|nr:Dual specificity phosphatase [Pleurostoma richardsiae]